MAKKKGEELIEDEIMNLKLVEIVYEQAIKAVPEKEHLSLFLNGLPIFLNWKFVDFKIHI